MADPATGSSAVSVYTTSVVFMVEFARPPWAVTEKEPSSGCFRLLCGSSGKKLAPKAPCLVFGDMLSDPKFPEMTAAVMKSSQLRTRNVRAAQAKFGEPIVCDTPVLALFQLDM
jgi:hypothetical protein